MELFIVKHYISDERPTIKGNGFDGLEIGADRQEAQEFIDWVNELIRACQRVGVTIKTCNLSGGKNG